MRTQLIPRGEWKRFLDNFGHKHEGWGITLEVFGSDIGDQLEEKDLYLAGLATDLEEGKEKIQIMIGERPDCHVTHVISEPTEVSLKQADASNNVALQIKSADGMTALLYLE